MLAARAANETLCMFDFTTKHYSFTTIFMQQEQPRSIVMYGLQISIHAMQNRVSKQRGRSLKENSAISY